MYDTVVYGEVVADRGVYLSVPGRRRPAPGSNDVSGAAAASRAKTQSSVYHGDRKLRTCDNRATTYFCASSNTTTSLSIPSFQ